ncbi:LEAF RUST 10 DISEASE-RESISTANCE LOCUS RECEPTOR-LIKE PROTEIN KINASE-like 2.7 [Sesamum alatum]|uniref:non-specific serine/threonine protein kinase n=1 Tax=Sesamum alatum TaxID=300844 RepID=A0AAE2CLJ3_9LAMI|nr:LEAF RUST 10 DISEASE-RESISTANCE LOCUS RECEPTOR-LIKE PROTEIN KINASE-like 2.7 [Sesamum alatum]
MNSQSISRFSFLHLLFTITLLILFQARNGSAYADDYYRTCSNTFSCGSTITGIRYPFRGPDDPPHCGHPGFVLICDAQNNVTNIDIASMKYRVLEIDQTNQTMRIAREDVMEAACPREMMNTTLDYSIFNYAAECANFTFLYGCPDLNLPDFSYAGARGPGICNASVIVPGHVTGTGDGGFLNGARLVQEIQQGFLISWKIGGIVCSDCAASDGRCGYDFETNQTTCFCSDPPYVSDTCTTVNGTSQAKKEISSHFPASLLPVLARIYFISS